jgi:hypothetical protein
LPNPDEKEEIALRQMVKFKVIQKKEDGYFVEKPLVRRWILEFAEG